MALRLCRTVAGVARRTALITSFRASSHGPSIDPQKGKIESDDVSMPDALGHAVGPERFELLAKLAGNEDPFEMQMRKRGKGTKDEPTLIASMFEKRLVGCICEEDALTINWMFLYQGEKKRCQCGHWFNLVEMKHVDYGQ